MPKTNLPADYTAWLGDLKTMIKEAQQRAIMAVNAEMIMVYWRIGNDILERQEAQGWGAKVIDRLSADLRSEFGGAGFSPRNLKYMRRSAAEWPDVQFVQQAAAQIPWFHNCIILDKIEDSDTRKWYVKAAFKHGWSRNVLVHQIETRLHERTGKAITNFAKTLPPSQSDLAQETFRDPYVLDFVDLAEGAHERHLEAALIERIKDFLIELGSGFSYVGNQYHVQAGGNDYYYDLLFYHYRLHSFVVIDLKMDEFKPEYAGKMAFYLNVADDCLRGDGDNPSIGLILCRGKNGLVVEYTLRDMSKPIGVAEYRVLPPDLAKALPSPDELEEKLSQVIESTETAPEGNESSGVKAPKG
ncbi:MAG: PDDEXK nuclease domain-containing protein [Magnetospirillum sp.]|nr:PDDEXK nuclease domain-containing protein [Magnetospirillum sp.]